MVALAVDRAPIAPLPLRYLRLAPAWGVVAAALVLFLGADAFASRWAPGTVALVHAFTLGVLGNAMLGSLLQFLPVVAGVRPLAMERLGPVLPVAFNVGVLGMVCALLHWHAMLPWAAVLPAAALALFAASALGGLRFDGSQTVLRAGLGATLVALLATAVLGLVLALAMAGRIAVPLMPVADVHAALGVCGGALLLCAVVGSVVLPMLQGTAQIPRRALAAWIGALVTALVAAVAARLTRAVDGDAMAWFLAAPVATFALGVLVLQWRAPHRRNPTLVAFWRFGAVAILLATAVALGWPDPRRAVLVGVLGLGVALPSLVLGMLIEIVPFVSWLELQRMRAGRARVPGVDTLLPEAEKARLLAWHLVAGVALSVAAAWPGRASAIGAAAGLAAAYGATLATLHALRRRCREFTDAA